MQNLFSNLDLIFYKTMKLPQDIDSIKIIKLIYNKYNKGFRVFLLFKKTISCGLKNSFDNGLARNFQKIFSYNRF